MPCEFGFNKLSLSSIGAFTKEGGVRCSGTLILDEMKVRRAVTFNKQTYKVDGFVDYGDNEESTAVADHALAPYVCPPISFMSATDCQLCYKKCCAWKSSCKNGFGSHRLEAIQALPDPGGIR